MPSTHYSTCHHTSYRVFLCGMACSVYWLPRLLPSIVISINFTYHLRANGKGVSRRLPYQSNNINSSFVRVATLDTPRSSHPPPPSSHIFTFSGHLQALSPHCHYLLCGYDTFSVTLFFRGNKKSIEKMIATKNQVNNKAWAWRRMNFMSSQYCGNIFPNAVIDRQTHLSGLLSLYPWPRSADKEVA